MIYFETKAKCARDMGDGKVTNTPMVYVVRALSYTDAEQRVIEIVSHYAMDGLPEVEIKKVKYQDVFTSDNPNADKFYKAKVVYTILDGEGDNLREKKVAQLFLVQAWDIKSTLASLEKNLKDGMSDFTIHTVSETKVEDYFDFMVADVVPAEATLDAPAAL